MDVDARNQAGDLRSAERWLQHWKRRASSLACAQQVRRRRPALSPIERAEVIGYRDGRGDIHYLPRLNFSTGDEWLAWLKGWRRGQAELRGGRYGSKSQVTEVSPADGQAHNGTTRPPLIP